ncbi:hypothetical protein M4951_05995 [Blastopirellula sp. J2-11]|uniref:hypothetical protein n=1 Tax=Blastopirellula sp. J2-11 TaxID=2943192 RepID=UPI0021C889DB|nr:hypothetical protein [Blastopirellula sp. J2-11]UUO07862.1 hypothetical protein M4951_05995 [Blastopirellula sp. J2-11]
MPESSKEVVLTRRELYDKVWSTPMMRLAAEYGLSDVGLAKICKRHKIPRPPRGYWAKLESGKKVYPHPLTPLKDESLQTVRLWQPDDPVQPLANKRDAIVDPKIAQLIEQEADDEFRIMPSADLRAAHPFVTATRDMLTECKPDEYGRLRLPRERSTLAFDLNVSKANLRRALLIVDTLLKAFKKRGYTCDSSNDKKEPGFAILGWNFTISMWESSKRYARKRSEGLNENDLDYWFFRDYEYKPTGNLELRIYPLGTIRDTKTTPLESRLQGLMIRILREIDDWQVRAEQARIEEDKKQARKLAAIEREIDRRQDGVRAANLSQAIPIWENAMKVRGYVDAVREEAVRRYGMVDEASEVGLWLIWAENYLATIDPLGADRNLPVYSLTNKEVDALRIQCEEDWSDYSETFSRSRWRT